MHAGFYRLSEDLDFVIPVKEPSTRKERRRLVAGAKELFDSMAHRPGGMHVAEMLRGANQSRQYQGRVRYRSVLTGEEQTIKIEVSLRESLLAPAEKSAAKTILISPVKEDQLVDPIPILCINFKEAMAEKFRAALTRREVAIRDFYDIDYAVRNLGLDVEASSFKELVKAKLAVPGNDPVKLDPGRFEELRSQMDGRLKPVLRPDDYQVFDLDRAIRHVDAIAGDLRKVSKS